VHIRKKFDSQVRKKDLHEIEGPMINVQA